MRRHMAAARLAHLAADRGGGKEEEEEEDEHAHFWTWLTRLGCSEDFAPA